MFPLQSIMGKTELGISVKKSPFSESDPSEGSSIARRGYKFPSFVLDPEKCSRLSLDEKRELVHEIAQWSNDAPQILSSFSRRELLEIICAEMGKERKYTGYTKQQMIEHLLKLLSQKSMEKSFDNIPRISQEKVQNGMKRQKIRENPLETASEKKDVPPDDVTEAVKFRVCENLACKAKLVPEDVFCKRCSCCICYCYDDNKDPSLWLVCGSDSPNEDDSCGMSCHLQCALKHERTGIRNNGSTKLDGSYFCVSCGRVNGLMRTWRRQLSVAKGARRVDVLCLRILLAHATLNGTERYKEVQTTVDTAINLLKNEVGPLDQVSREMARGIVNRLSCGSHVQRLCASAMEAFDSMFHEKNPNPRCSENVETSRNCRPAILGRQEPKCTAPALHGNIPEVLEDHEKEKAPQIAQIDSQMESTNSSEVKVCFNDHTAKPQTSKDIYKDTNARIKSLPLPLEGGSAIIPTLLSPSTPSKLNETQDITTVLGCKRQAEESEYEYSVRVIKWLELHGFIDKYFRVRFLTWFSLKATKRERRVVSVFVDTLIDDPSSLAGQLVHTFMDEICCDKKLDQQHSFCSRSCP